MSDLVVLRGLLQAIRDKACETRQSIEYHSGQLSAEQAEEQRLEASASALEAAIAALSTPK